MFKVIAYRWGNKEFHSYIVGVYKEKSEALSEACKEEHFRGNKYECEVIDERTNDIIKKLITFTD